MQQKSLRISPLLLLTVFAVLILFLALIPGKSMLKSLYPIKYESIIEKYSEKYNIDETLILAVIKTESSFDPSSVSEAGAMGLMQVMPETHEWLSGKLGRDENPSVLFDEDTGIEYGTYLLRILLDEFHNIETAIAAYHAGIGRVGEWLKDERYSSDGITLDVIPFKDTAHYVNKIKRAVQIYENLY